MKTKKANILHSLLIILIILGIITLQIIVKINAVKNNYFIYTSIFTILMLLLISVLSIFPRKNNIHRKLSFNIPFLSVWILMCLCMLYSDIVVFKKYWFLSLILLVLFTTLFCVSQQYTKEERDNLWNCLIYSVRIIFIFSVIFCFLFRPYTSGVRYMGLSTNPNVYARFIITVWICLISRFDYIIYTKGNIKNCMFIYAEAGCALFFLYMTGARTSFAAIAFITAIWFFFRLFFARKSGQVFIKYILAAIPVMAISFFVSYGLLATVPHLINHPITFERDEEYLAEYSNDSICLAAGSDTTANPKAIDEIEQDIESAIDNVNNEPSLLKRIIMTFRDGESLDNILNGRITIYKSYIKQLDMKGHRKYGKKVNDYRAPHAHNNILQMGYSYGIPAMIFYIILNIFSIILSLRYYIRYHDKRRNSVLPLLITFGFTIASLTECMLIPIQSLLAFSYYLCIGELINTQKS